MAVFNTELNVIKIGQSQVMLGCSCLFNQRNYDAEQKCAHPRVYVYIPFILGTRYQLAGEQLN